MNRRFMPLKQPPISGWKYLKEIIAAVIILLFVRMIGRTHTALGQVRLVFINYCLHFDMKNTGNTCYIIIVMLLIDLPENLKRHATRVIKFFNNMEKVTIKIITFLQFKIQETAMTWR